MKKFLYVDVEWANSKNKSICQIGLVSEDFDTEEPIYPELNLYINPEDQYDDNCIAIHHITPEKTKNSMTFKEAWPQLEKYFINSVIVGHNVKNSDLNAIVKNLQRYDIDIPELWCIDTYELSRKLVSPLDVSNYQLSTLCDYFDIDIDNEHDAFDDACACADLLRVLMNTFKINLDNYIERYSIDDTYEFVTYISSSELRREIAALYGLINGIDIDEQIQEKEIQYIIRWRKEHEIFSKYDSVSYIIRILDNILDDYTITSEEINYLKSVITTYLQEVNTSKETLATQFLQGILSGISADETIDDSELKLQKWLYENSFLEGHYPYDKLIQKIEEILSDKTISAKEKEELKQLFDEITNPIKELNDVIVNFQNNSFCLSGNFDYGSKESVKKYIENKGGSVDKTVKKSTNYVVIGNAGSNRYTHGNYGSKVKKAMENGITILKENQLFN